MYKKLLLNDRKFIYLNFIELLAIFKLITIGNSSGGNNINPQVTSRLVK